MYIRNKLIFLRNSGWCVDVVAGKAENVVVKELQEFKNQYPELLFNKCLFSRQRQRRVVDRLVRQLIDPDFEDIIIESSTIETSLWAESVAKKMGARHLVFLLTEYNNVQNNTLRDFFVFKHSRHELVGITSRSISDLFKSFHPISVEESYSLVAYCTNVEADIDHPLLHQLNRNDYDYIIGGLSRMDKPFVVNALFDLCKFAKSYPNKRFLFLWIGDAPHESCTLKEVMMSIQALDNVVFMKTGYILPVPTRLLELCDVFVSSAGSSWTCFRSGVPTITYDTNDCKPIGVLGRTTNNYVFRDKNEMPIELKILLEQVLIKKKYIKSASNYNMDLPDFSEHLEFLSKMKQPQEYYNVNSFRIELLSEKKISLGLTMLGIKGYIYLHSIKERI